MDAVLGWNLVLSLPVILAIACRVDHLDPDTGEPTTSTSFPRT
jgi:hypothetical protein